MTNSVRHAELRVQRSITDAFIAASPIVIQLTPRTRTVTATGGWTYTAGVVRQPQVFRLIEMGGAYRPSKSLDGVERKYDFELLGSYNVEVEVGDTFTYRGTRYEIIELMPDLGYEVRAAVTAHG